MSDKQSPIRTHLCLHPVTGRTGISKGVQRYCARYVDHKRCIVRHHLESTQNQTIPSDMCFAYPDTLDGSHKACGVRRCSKHSKRVSNIRKMDFMYRVFTKPLKTHTHVITSQVGTETPIVRLFTDEEIEFASFLAINLSRTID